MSKQKSNPVTNKAKIPDEDKISFREAVADVRPLNAEKRISPVKKQPSPRPLQKHHSEPDDLHTDMEMMSDPADLRDVKIQDQLFYARSGIQFKMQKKLRRGEFPVEDELDLHGYTSVEAKAAIYEFIEYCKQQHKRCIRIIHGKGYRSQEKIPVLKTYVAHWLPQHNDVMAFCSARPEDGGTGALYVILKVVR